MPLLRLPGRRWRKSKVETFLFEPLIAVHGMVNSRASVKGGDTSSAAVCRTGSQSVTFSARLQGFHLNAMELYVHLWLQLGATECRYTALAVSNGP